MCSCCASCVKVSCLSNLLRPSSIAEDAAAVVHKFDGLTLEGRVIQVELGVDRASMAERKASIVAKRLERGVRETPIFFTFLIFLFIFRLLF